MNEQQAEKIKQLENLQVKLVNSWMDYWQQYSDFSSWQFWVNVGFLVVPLIVLFLVINRRKALLLGFFGYSVHMLFTYIDAIGTNSALWIYPYKALPLITSNFSIDASLVPVTYMLVYQWVLNHERNYYVIITGICLFMAFILKPLMVGFGLFQLNEGTGFTHLFIGYLTVAIGAKLLTNAFIILEKKAKTDF